MSNRPTLLDVEDDDQRQNRIGTLLERLDTASSSSTVSLNPLLNIGRERIPGPVKPPFELLARIKAFLPAIAASNKALSQQKPEDVDIENILENEEQYIEMNLGLGVLEAKPRSKPGSRPTSPTSETETASETASDATSSESGSDSASSRSSSEEESDYSSASISDDSDAESQPESPTDIKLVSRPIKSLPRAKIEA